MAALVSLERLVVLVSLIFYLANPNATGYIRCYCCYHQAEEALFKLEPATLPLCQDRTTPADFRTDEQGPLRTSVDQFWSKVCGVIFEIFN